MYADSVARCAVDDVVLVDWSDTASLTSPIEVVSFEDTGGTERLLGRGPSSEPESGASPNEGRVVAGRYVLGRQLGVGGYGAVFDAHDKKLDRRVALKLLSPVIAENPTALSRFHQEAIAASRINHEGILDVYDFGCDESGNHYICMEFLDGFDLAEVLQVCGALEPFRALRIAQQCAGALATAHTQGVLHRDLKPANIFLTSDDRRIDAVRIIDFGISKVLRGSGRIGDVTRASAIVGTPFYMAPEQARRAAEDGKSDVYSLGTILFEMLTGERAFSGSSPLAILKAHAEDERTPPSHLRPTLREIRGLDELVADAMAIDPSVRPTMEEFGSAIAEIVDAPRQAAMQEDTHAPARSAPSVSRSGFFLVTAVIALAGAGFVGYVMARDSPTDVTAKAAAVTEEGPLADRPSEASAPSTAEAVRAQEPEVTVRVTSSPSGAQVRDGEELLGQTPLVISREALSGSPLQLVLAGFADAEVEVSADSPRVHVALSRKVAAEPKSPKPPSKAVKGDGPVGISEW